MARGRSVPLSALETAVQNFLQDQGMVIGVSPDQRFTYIWSGDILYFRPPGVPEGQSWQVDDDWKQRAVRESLEKPGRQWFHSESALLQDAFVQWTHKLPQIQMYADEYITITAALVHDCRLDVDSEVFRDGGDEVDAGSFGYAWGDGPWLGGFDTEGDAFAAALRERLSSCQATVEADEAALQAQGI